MKVNVLTWGGLYVSPVDNLVSDDELSMQESAEVIVGQIVRRTEQ